MPVYVYVIKGHLMQPNRLTYSVISW